MGRGATVGEEWRLAVPQGRQSTSKELGVSVRVLTFNPGVANSSPGGPRCGLFRQ